MRTILQMSILFADGNHSLSGEVAEAYEPEVVHELEKLYATVDQSLGLGFEEL
jgi:hypothetical protein